MLILVDLTLKFISLGRNFIFLEREHHFLEHHLSSKKLFSVEDNEKRIQER